ncbi:hypothetical protein [Endozoicomonas elysicola]|uniref:Uncharacterized protein n=1 Tax=Endozoicomonas elysicola TaxID=305900 RepID=A0A081KA08_9GAMM|nr:hypothetical protein [Endozoicomonas elysicola]KEI70984.1 hypothetical protein GV64_09720 [Endozoicomonas elysicola]
MEPFKKKRIKGLINPHHKKLKDKYSNNMKPEHANLNSLLIYPTDHPRQDKSDSATENKKYIPSGQVPLTKTPIGEYNIGQTNYQKRQESAVYSETSTEDNQPPVRKSNRKRKKKLPFDEQYRLPEKNKARKVKPNNVPNDEVLFKKYGYLPKGAKRSEQLDSGMEMEAKSECPEWNVWPEKYHPKNCVPHTKILLIQTTKSPDYLQQSRLSDTPIENAVLPFENAKLLNQPLMKDFLELSREANEEESEKVHFDESLFDVTDFIPFYQMSPSLKETRKCRSSLSTVTPEPRINLENILKKKRVLFQQITICVKDLKEETTKWDAYRDARENLAIRSDGEIQFKALPETEELRKIFDEKMADLVRAQKEYEHKKIKLEHLIARLKVLQKEASTLTLPDKPGLELVSISELIRRMRDFTCFFLESKSYNSLMSILAIEPYRREKSQVLSEAEPLIAKLEDKRGTWCKRTQRRKLTQFRDSLMQLKSILENIKEHQHQLEESEAIDRVLDNLNLFSNELRTKQHDETYRCLTNTLHNLEWDIVRC